MSHLKSGLQSSPTPEAAAEKMEALNYVRQELAELSPEERAVVVLCCQEGLNLSEAAESLSEPRETVRDRLARTLDDLRQRLRRRGLLLPLVALIGYIGEGQHEPAPATLCHALDTHFPGTQTATISPAKAEKSSISELIKETGLDGARWNLKAAAILAGMFLVLGFGVMELKSVRVDLPQPTRITISSEDRRARPDRPAPAQTTEQTEQKEVRDMNGKVMSAVSATALAVAVNSANVKAEDAPGAPVGINRATPGATTGAAERKDSDKAAITAALKKAAAAAAQAEKARNDPKNFGGDRD